MRRAAGGGSLVMRTAAVSIALAVSVGMVSALLLVAIGAQRDAAVAVRRGQQALLASGDMGILIVDLETGQRGFIITGKEQFLEPWAEARADFPGVSADFQRRANQSGYAQAARARDIIRDTSDYIVSYSIPLVNTARTDLAAARSDQVTAQGKRLVDTLRSDLDGFRAQERGMVAARQNAADEIATLAIVAAGVGLGVSVMLVLLSGAYLARRVVRPVREAAGMAGQVAGGDLAVRMPGTGPAEVGVLQRAFNAMAGSLQDSQDRLRRSADEQAALRRVATLVASGAPPPEVFAAVAAETGEVLGAAVTAVVRYAPEDTMMVVGSWTAFADETRTAPVGSLWPLEEGSVSAEIRQTGRPAQREYGQVNGTLSAWARQQGLRSAIGSPVFVEGRLWGIVIAFADRSGLRPAAVQARMQAFTELTAMAVANSESREQLAASRARVVAAADESRRRIERDLHDGIQQRLISLGLEMRSTAGKIRPGQAELREQWDRTAQYLTEVTEDLRELSRGLHPAILVTGGLAPALRSLARRSALPVTLNVAVRERLPEQTETAAYYVVSEALTNVAKHARAAQVQVDVQRSGDSLRVRVRDDGQGGADPARGSGLVGLSDRVEALNGRISINSPPGAGTVLLATIPVPQWREGDAT